MKAYQACWSFLERCVVGMALGPAGFNEGATCFLSLEAFFLSASLACGRNMVVLDLLLNCRTAGGKLKKDFIWQF